MMTLREWRRWVQGHDRFQLPGHLVASHVSAFCSLPFHTAVLEPHFHLSNNRQPILINEHRLEIGNKITITTTIIIS